MDNPYVKSQQETTIRTPVNKGIPALSNWNTANFGGYNRSGTPRLSEREKIFNDKGELNADNAKEALSQIQYILKSLGDGTLEAKPIQPQAQSIDPVEREEILKQAFTDPTGEGFLILGQELLMPIKEVIDYEGWARKVLAPRTVRQGEVIRYDKDVFVTAWVIADDGQTPEARVGGRYVYPPEFEVTANPTIELRDIYRAQYDILARIQDRARQGIEHQEDTACKKLLERAATTVNSITYFGSLNLAALEALRLQIERHRLVVDKFLINRNELSDLVTQLSQQVDPVTQRELIMAGYIGSVLNAMIITSAGTNTFEVVMPGEVFAVTAPEYLGGMPIRVELFSEPYAQFVLGHAVRGWFWYELISQVIISPGSVAKGIKS